MYLVGTTCYNGGMRKTYLRISDELNSRVTKIAKDQNKRKAEVFRQAIEYGLQKAETNNPALRNLANNFQF
ncbi:MAG: hypothetical protein A3D24_02820 [Candidatus Blackburnbacteria bacterium RIFCSPHIGHO2_02_FULL_39_13]|uniref:Ribbon-helix-helix protein CopG domain-containing protein n=1 Tax=Candidatus Blackburnbacteria bacterium RIFCSPLOWO2_01_FULL_40_20 TaxID=1797519 RepID=A0A1G1VBL1_9BACT|nr:MAG: hypothetical protein A2694_01725 [Candidatus Blackburnbacteria bacterium RIFCSPHIGHO2_01_FULL_40_17]OGY07756.1 MAG: hypothetical protein A3D24_02820 [Candidatus Blackburnbacteria bacterium RIFCSPHIGHO2_02_FULL_39_13]OGY12815.1 MAG: hypothetical protein A3A77_02985 [Candidatus Blackburnbacteria bacterium RIFCSPLOWO2_01_FULL_40_20]